MSNWNNQCEPGNRNGFDEYAGGLDLKALAITSNVIGWVYFLAWSISFYPQIILNYKRKSVVGFHFDLVYLNVLGYTAYSFFNCILYFSPAAQVEYCDNHGPPNPVHANDVFFAVHGLLLSFVIASQCFYYERGNQYVTLFAAGFGIPLWFWLIACLFLFIGRDIDILQMINWMSYVKLVVSFLKYLPQSYYNYKRKSTVGWSIYAILLDLTGGVLSLLQGVLDWINSGNVKLFFGDPTKFGLSIFTIFFDVLFMVQHYILYPERKDPFTEVEDEEDVRLQINT